MPSTPGLTPIAASRLERMGAWVFRQRSWTPVPLALVLLGARWRWSRAAWLVELGVVVILAGLAARFWAVSHIGTISRTRSRRLGPLTIAGPYALVRNPLYVGNFLIWTGCVLASGLLWMLPVAWGVFALQYSAITRYEEAALIQHFGDDYQRYAREVPRWVPRPGAAASRDLGWGGHRFGDVCFSERGTLIAAAAMTLLLIARFLWLP